MCTSVAGFRTSLASSSALFFCLAGASVGCAPSNGTARVPGADDAGLTASDSSNRDARFLEGDSGFSRGDAGFEACATGSVRAETRIQPVDVIWVVDSSGSMGEEAAIVQANVNNFAAAISASGIDYHVVFLTPRAFISVPPPLGTDAGRFLHVEEGVGSNDGLASPLRRFADYADFLREDAVTHVVVVTDDESGVPFGSFISQMEANLGHGLKLHSIASPPGSEHSDGLFSTDDGCEGPNGEAADNGDQYWAGSAATGGLTFSICTSDWTGLFSTLTEEIAQATVLPCRYPIPEAPDGSSVDRNRVNVIYTSSHGDPALTLGHSESEAACDFSAWYYDGDEVVLCPGACEVIGADDSGLVEIQLGCQTMLL